MYGGGSIVDLANAGARDLNVIGKKALDLRTRKPTGEPWDFRRKEDRQLACRTIEEDCPDWLIGSPPCTAYTIQIANELPQDFLGCCACQTR